MKRKFVKVMFFGALALSTVTYVGCKDYDDDIDNLQTQIDANKASIADLQKFVNEGLIAQIAEVRADIQLLKDDEEQAVKDKEEAEKRAEKAEKDLHSLEERRERLQPVMDNVSKEIKEYGTVKAILPEAGTLERATTYRDKKIKPLFTQMKNKIAAMAAQVKELTKEVEKWKHKYQEEEDKRQLSLF